MIQPVEAGMQGEQRENTTANIAFSIASILGDEVRPYLTFRSGQSDLVHCGENTYT